MSFLENKFARVLSVVLAAQAVVLYTAVSRAELVPVVRPLSQFPSAFGGWTAVQDVPIEPEIQEILKADDTLNRVYVYPAGGVEANVFIAYFKTQREGQSPHSPKNCQPGNGWQPVETGLISIAVPGRSAPITANRYIASHGDQKALIIYWYQSRNRIIASEYSAKFWLVADSIRYHRSDTALVKVVLRVGNDNIGAATNAGVAFVQALFPMLAQQLPQ